MKISIINLVAFFAIVIAVEAYKEDESFWDEFYELQNRERDVPLIVDNQIEKILEEVGFNTKGHGHRRINQIKKYTLCMSLAFAENVSPASGKWGEETPKSLLAGWMDSAGHKRNIQDSNNKYVGCARGRSGSNYSYICAFRADNRIDNLPAFPCSLHQEDGGRLSIWYQRCFFEGIEKIVSRPGTYPCNSVVDSDVCCV